MSVQAFKQASEWMQTQSQVLALSLQRSKADYQWGVQTLESLHTVAKIETLKTNSVEVVSRDRWDAYATQLANDLARRGEPYMEMKSKLINAKNTQAGKHECFDVSLNFEAGGSQYMTCTRFLVKGGGDSLLIVYSHFGKKWVELQTYRLNRAFWESSPNDKKVLEFLKHGANEGLVETLEDPETAGAAVPLQG